MRCAADLACRRSSGYVNTVAVVPASAPAANLVAMSPLSGVPNACARAALYMGYTAKVVAL